MTIPDPIELDESGRLPGWDIGEPAGARSPSQSRPPATLPIEQQSSYLLKLGADWSAEQRRLAKRVDDLSKEVTALRRELSAAKTATGVGGAKGRRGLRAFLSGLWRRSDADERPAADPAAPRPKGPAKALRPRSQADGFKAVAVGVIGLDHEALERVVETIATQACESRTLPILLTDCDRFEIFRRHRLIFEYFPAAALRTTFAPELDWELYTRRRFDLLCRKWRPSTLILFGEGPRQFVEAARDAGLLVTTSPLK
ncbi:MAG: hypothetical protein ACREDZ_10185 [Kiloniellales bacterium]